MKLVININIPEDVKKIVLARIRDAVINVCKMFDGKLINIDEVSNEDKN